MDTDTMYEAMVRSRLRM